MFTYKIVVNGVTSYVRRQNRRTAKKSIPFAQRRHAVITRVDNTSSLNKMLYAQPSAILAKSRPPEERIIPTEGGYQIVNRPGYGAELIVTPEGVQEVTQQTPPAGFNQFQPAGTYKYWALLCQARAAQDGIWYDIRTWESFIQWPRTDAIKALLAKYMY